MVECVVKTQVISNNFSMNTTPIHLTHWDWIDEDVMEPYMLQPPGAPFTNMD